MAGSFTNWNLARARAIEARSWAIFRVNPVCILLPNIVWPSRLTGEHNVPAASAERGAEGPACVGRALGKRRLCRGVGRAPLNKNKVSPRRTTGTNCEHVPNANTMGLLVGGAGARRVAPSDFAGVAARPGKKAAYRSRVCRSSDPANRVGTSKNRRGPLWGREHGGYCEIPSPERPPRSAKIPADQASGQPWTPRLKGPLERSA